MLLVHVFDDCFNDDVRARRVFEAGRSTQPRQRLILVLGSQLPLLDRSGKLFVDPTQALLQKLFGDLDDSHFTTRLRADLRDARAHQPAPEHRYVLNCHCLFALPRMLLDQLRM